MDSIITENINNNILIFRNINFKDRFIIPKDIEYLYIKDCTLSKLFDCNLENIKHIEMQNVSDITSLDFSNFSNKVETIIIKNMAFYELPDFSHLENLKTLVLEDNDFVGLSIEKMPPKLEHLGFSNNPIDMFDISHFSDCFKTLVIENVKLKEQPEFVCNHGFDIKYSFNQNCLKKCEICFNQIYTLQPYYNKNNDGFFICEPCHNNNLETCGEGYIKKINENYGNYYCDNIDCKKRLKKNIFFDSSDSVYVNVNLDSDFMFCEDCYESYEEEFPEFVKMNIDILEERIYRLKNSYFVMNINKYDLLAEYNDILDDIYSHNSGLYLKSILKANPPNTPYNHHDLHSVLQFKYKFPKIDLNILDSSLMENLFLSNNLYMIEYFIRNMRFSMKDLKDYFWKVMYYGHTETIIFLLCTFPLFFNNDTMINTIKDIELRLFKIIRNNKLENLKFLEYKFNITCDDLSINQELFEYLCINEHLDMLYYINHDEELDFQCALNKLLKCGDYKSPTFYEVCEMIYDLSDYTDLDYKFPSVSNCKVFVENVLKNGEDINFIKSVFTKTKDSVTIGLPLDVFVTACKNEDIDYCKMFVELFPAEIFIEIEDNIIVDYGKIGQGLFKPPLECFKSVEPIECCICMDNISTIITNCKHMFCKPCIKRTIDNKPNCPLCRQTIENKVYYLAS